MTTKADVVSLLNTALAGAQSLPDDPVVDPQPVDPPADGFPAWRAGKPKDVWLSIASTLPSVVPPSQVDVYTGYAVGDDTVLSLPASGHWSNPTFRNAVYKLLMNVDAPVWALDCPPTPAAQITPQATFPRTNADGKPVPFQSYNHTHYVKGEHLPDGKDRGFALFHTTCAVPSGQNPYSTYQVDGYRVADQAWDAGGPAPGGPSVGGTWNDIPIPSNGLISWAQGQDPRTGFIYYANGGASASTGTRIVRFKPMTNEHEILWPGTITGIGNSWLGWVFTPIVVDTKRNRLVMLVKHNTQMWLETVSMDTWRWSYTVVPSFTGPSNFVTSWSADACTMVYDPDGDRYLAAFGHTGQIWVIDPDTAAAVYLNTAPGTTSHGINNRFAYMEGMGGVIYHADPTLPVPFMPTR